MDEQKAPKKEPIYVSRKILADVGRGIYRTPANALKELVSNAFDACATLVKISTNAPYFDVFTCEDNGTGMLPNEFKEHFKRIGSSIKRRRGREIQTCENIGVKRPIIGKIGIGLLAVAQICSRFTIISKKKGSRFCFKATVDLEQFEREDSYLSGEQEIKLGEYEIYEEIPVAEEDIDKSYTKIIMESLKEGFRRELKNEYEKQILKPKEHGLKANTFADFLRGLSRLKDFKSLSAYDYMLWELGVLCPVQYLLEDAEENVVFPQRDYISEDVERLKAYRFRVLVDGIEIKKSSCFFTNDNIAKDKEGEDYKIYRIPPFDEEIEGERLRFHGYLYSQRVKIRPTELQGILIRIKDVGIGNYDRTLLKYPREEGPIFGMISGEIFVEQGLENALNIDRNSFNETHPHYQRLKFELHNFIKNTVVKDIRARSKLRRQREQKETFEQELISLAQRLKDEWDLNFSLTIEQGESEFPYKFDKRQNKLFLFVNSPFWAKSQKARFYQAKAIMTVTALRILSKRGIAEDTIDKIIQHLLRA